MTRTAMMTAIALTFAAPAFANDAEDIVNLGKISPAAIADEHFEGSEFMADEDLGVTSPAEIDAEVNDTISTQSVDQERLELLGVDSPAERAVYQ